mmetsp:Transcript_65582/g.155390  ORF Transcript_65582/g.155390 Transcript_65582/m.155390 type:complete len:277 (-) Transcript_65582:24-854(-)
MVLLEERVSEDEVLVSAVRRVTHLGEELRRHSRMLQVVAEGCRQEGEALPCVEARHGPGHRRKREGRLHHVEHVVEVVVGVVEHGGADREDEAAHAVLGEPRGKPRADEHLQGQVAEDVVGEGCWVEGEAEQLLLAGGENVVVDRGPVLSDSDGSRRLRESEGFAPRAVAQLAGYRQLALAPPRGVCVADGPREDVDGGAGGAGDVFIALPLLGGHHSAQRAAHFDLGRFNAHAPLEEAIEVQEVEVCGGGEGVSRGDGAAVLAVAIVGHLVSCQG